LPDSFIFIFVIFQEKIRGYLWCINGINSEKLKMARDKNDIKALIKALLKQKSDGNRKKVELLRIKYALN